MGQLKAVFVESGFWGTVLALAGMPAWTACVSELQKIGLEDAKIFAIIGAFFHLVVYLTMNVPFGLCDYFGWLQDWKLHRNESSLRPSRKLIVETLIGAAVNHFLMFPALIYVSFQALGQQPVDAPLPSIADIFVAMVYGHLFNDVAFYFTHRAFHTKALYWLHKQHHSFGGTMGIAAEHANPVEALVANVFPTLGGVVFFGCKHPWVSLVWVLVRVQQTCFAHSGYNFGGTLWDTVGLTHAHETIFHDHHHTRNQGNFGCLAMDYLFGTCDHFVKAGLYDGYVSLSKQRKEAKKAA